MFSLRSLVFGSLLVFCIWSACYGQINKVADKDPFYGPNDQFWANITSTYPFPLLDGNNNYQILNTKVCYASTNLQTNHDYDSQDLLHGHFHFRDDYPAASNIYNVNYLGQANAYWDVIFQNGIQKNINRFADATTARNCFSYVLINRSLIDTTVILL